MSDTEVDYEALDALREPFSANMVGKLPKGGVELDYVGHGAVTSRLLEVDPLWSWEPMSFDNGLPRFTYDAQGNPIALWIRLTVCGVTRIGCGTCRANQFDAEKVLIGDAIRNAAMRFGVALDLWIRGHAEDDEKHAASSSQQAPTRQPFNAKKHLLSLCDGDTDKAADAWKAMGADPSWSKDLIEAGHLEWLNADPAEVTT